MKMVRELGNRNLGRSEEPCPALTSPGGSEPAQNKLKVGGKKWNLHILTAENKKSNLTTCESRLRGFHACVGLEAYVDTQ